VQDLFTALALAVAIEGILYALFPDAMKRMMATVQAQPVANLRAAGLVAATLAVFVVWMIRG
jgi:uncharacterized protein YjeT (DUF2065 family)